MPFLAFPSTQAIATCPSKVSQGQILQSVPKGLNIKGSSFNTSKQNENQGLHNVILRFYPNSGSWLFKIETATSTNLMDYPNNNSQCFQLQK